MQITPEFIEKEIAHLEQQNQQAIAQVNATSGALQVLRQLQTRLAAKDSEADPKTEKPAKEQNPDCPPKSAAPAKSTETRSRRRSPKAA